MRKLASVQKIESISPIPGADRIVMATVLGWECVVRKGEFQPGDRVIYCEVDSVLPELPEYEFLRKNCFVDNGEVRGYRIRTVRLKGQYSQGLVLPLSVDAPIGTDITDELGIVKFRDPVPVCLRGKIRGNFPAYIPKTDEPRIQATPGTLERYRGEQFTLTEKIDGTSCTMFRDQDTGLHVCSRNLDMAPSDDHKFNGTAYWDIAIDYNMDQVLKDIGTNYAVQGELFGKGIQGNPYNLKKLCYKIFNVWDTSKNQYLAWDDVKLLFYDLGLGHMLVPEVGTITLNHVVNEILTMANGQSQISNVPREGLVFRADPAPGKKVSFKAINKGYNPKMAH